MAGKYPSLNYFYSFQLTYSENVGGYPVSQLFRNIKPYSILTYRKFKADQLFTGTEMLDRDKVLVTDASGSVIAIVDQSEAGEDVQHLNGILSPGFINCHCHLELSHMKGMVPEQTGLVDFVFAVVNDRHFPDEEILDAINQAEDEMLRNGIVAVGDICNNNLSIPQKKQNRLAYYNFIEVSGWLPAVAKARFEKSSSFYQTFRESLTSPYPNHLSLSPHAPYSVSDDLWEWIIPGFTGKTISIHNQETPFEDSLFEEGKGDFNRMYAKMQLDNSFFNPSGKSSLQSFMAKMVKASQVILVHNTFTHEADIDFAHQQHKQVNWCICIRANQYIEHAVPPLELLQNKKCNLVLGTDSLASNHGLDILAEMQTIHKHFPKTPLTDLLTWATSNGAKALQMNDRFGSFEIGKKPGVLVIEGANDGTVVKHSRVKRLL